MSKFNHTPYTGDYEYAYDHRPYHHDLHTQLFTSPPFLTSKKLVEPKSPTLPSAPAPAPPEPAPSEEYLKISLSPSARLETPTKRRKLLILDLNGTLVYREQRPQHSFASSTPYHLGGRRRPRGNATRYKHPRSDQSSEAPPPPRVSHPRPYMPTFRKFISHPATREWLDTMVWSSAQPHSVEDMVTVCFNPEKKAKPHAIQDGTPSFHDDAIPLTQPEVAKPVHSSSNHGLVAVWARDTLGLAKEDYNRKTQTTKDLTAPWAKLKLTLASNQETDASTKLQEVKLEVSNENASRLEPLYMPQHSAQTTLLLDDSPLKARLQPWNHVCVAEYGKNKYHHDQEVLERLRSEDSNSTELNSGAKREISGEEGVDETLLAVIGILNAIKWESNVSGWVRAGGLLSKPTPNTDIISSRTALSSGEDTPHGKPLSKRPRPGKVEPDGNIQNLDAIKGITEDEVPIPGMSSLPDDAPVPGLDGVLGASTVGQPSWFEDPDVMSYWVSRGRTAAADLGVEIDHGLSN